MEYKAIIFDVDGVLFDSFEANLKFFQDLMKYTGHKIPSAEDYRKVYWKTMDGTIKDLTGLENENEIAKIISLYDEGIVKIQTEMIKMPSGATQTIKNLAEKYLLGIATGRRNVFIIPEIIALQNLFSATMTARDTSKHKPDPEPLLLAAKKLECEPNECIYIGDQETDVLASRAAGMKFIGYGPKQLPGAEFWTDDFTKIPELVYLI